MQTSELETNDTIGSIVTSVGKAGVGIIRVSGCDAHKVLTEIVKIKAKPRYAHYVPFYAVDESIIDQGIALFFPKPHSLTGEDVIELQGHGGSVVMDMLLQRILSLGVRQSKPGEFLERAFLNNKIDLNQAESIADLIEASSEQAARSAVRSLSGEFSNSIHQLVNQLTTLRMYVESAIDFPEEEIDFLSDGKIETKTKEILSQVTKILDRASQGVLLREGMSIAITGQPNVGKSSLLNLLSATEAAIVTDIAGTTRDILKQEINIDGMPIHLVDTAGIRDNSECEVEKIGINRAWEEINKADNVLLIVDANKGLSKKDLFILEKINHNKVTIIYNKIDIAQQQEKIQTTNLLVNAKNELTTEIYLSVKNNQGIDILKRHLKQVMGYQQQVEGVFSARRRHIKALEEAKKSIEKGLDFLLQFQAGEILAEELLLAQNSLSQITGDFSSDDLLGKIFSDFCIGK